MHGIYMFILRVDGGAFDEKLNSGGESDQTHSQIILFLFFFWTQGSFQMEISGESTITEIWYNLCTSSNQY